MWALHVSVKDRCITSVLITVFSLGCLVGIPGARSVDFAVFNARAIDRKTGNVPWKKDLVWKGPIQSPDTVDEYVKTLLSPFQPAGSDGGKEKN